MQGRYYMNNRSLQMLFFDIAFCAYIFCFAIGQSDAISLLRLTSPLLLLSKTFSVAAFLCSGRKQIMYVVLFIIVISIAQYLKIEYKYEVVAKCLLVFAGLNISVNHILKVSFYSILLSLLFILITILVGLNEDYILQRGIVVKGLIAHTMGFRHYSGFSFRVVGLTFMFMYINRKSLTAVKFAIIILANVAVMCFSLTRLHVICSSLMIIFAFFIYKKKVFIPYNSILKYCSFIIFPATALFYIALGSFSILTGTNIFDWWDENFSGRMLFTLQAFENYGIKAWGNMIEMTGTRTASAGRGIENFYIDSGYAYWILAYGYIFTFFIIAAYSTVLYKCYKNKEFYLYMITIICSISNLINDFFNFVEAFPVLFLVFANFKPHPLQDLIKKKVSTISK